MELMELTLICDGYNMDFTATLSFVSRTKGLTYVKMSNFRMPTKFSCRVGEKRHFEIQQESSRFVTCSTFREVEMKIAEDAKGINPQI